jgi:hypothetical protein
MYLVNPITTTPKPISEYQREFAICESCFWCATIFHKADSSSNNNDSLQHQQQQICPLCKNKGISLIPLAKDEGYMIAMEGKRGLEMEFSRHSRR